MDTFLIVAGIAAGLVVAAVHRRRTMRTRLRHLRSRSKYIY